jgi:hypothetical protein
MIPSHRDSLVDASSSHQRIPFLRSQSSFAGASVYSLRSLSPPPAQPPSIHALVRVRRRAGSISSSGSSSSTQLSMFVRVLSPFRDRGAGNAVEVLMECLAPKTKVKRSGSWSEIESVDLVAGYMLCTFTPFLPCPSAVPPLPCSSLIVLATHISLR